MQSKFSEVDPKDSKYKQKMEKKCKEFLHHLKEDYSLVYSSTILQNQYVEVEPLYIHVRADATPTLQTVAREYPVRRRRSAGP